MNQSNTQNTSMQPIVSVIIPAFNAEHLIQHAIDSILSQKFSQDTEILVVDDNSTDNTKTVVRNIAKTQKQVRLLQNERKKGPSGARNTGILNAAGQFIAFLDADDIWHDNHLQEGILFMHNNPEVDVVFFNFDIVVYDSKKKLGDWFSTRKYPAALVAKELHHGFKEIDDNIFNALVDESFMHLQSMILRKSKINGLLFEEDIRRSEDRDFAIKLFMQAKARFAYKNLITGTYYHHQNSLTSDSNQNNIATLLDHIKLFERYLQDKDTPEETVSKLKTLLSDKSISLSYFYRQEHELRLSLQYLLKSIEYNKSLKPHHLREFTKLFATSFIRK